MLSGQEACGILERHGFTRVRQRGNHIVMQRVTADGTTTVPVPDHPELRTGTLRSIIRAVFVMLATWADIYPVLNEGATDGNVKPSLEAAKPTRRSAGGLPVA